MRWERQFEPRFRSPCEPRHRKEPAGGAGFRHRRPRRDRAVPRRRCAAGPDRAAGRPPGCAADAIAVGAGRTACLSTAQPRARGDRFACHASSRQIACAAARQRSVGTALGRTRWPHAQAGARITSAAAADTAAIDARHGLPAAHCAGGGGRRRAAVAGHAYAGSDAVNCTSGCTVCRPGSRTGSGHGNCECSRHISGGIGRTSCRAIAANSAISTAGAASAFNATSATQCARCTCAAWRAQHHYCRGCRPRR
jgi:hypothetical protein